MGALSDAESDAGSLIDSDADARDARAQRRTWVTGAIVLGLRVGRPAPAA